MKIVYVDDDISATLEEFLDRYCDDNKLSFETQKYNCKEAYESFITNSIIQSANIIIIDSWLFENTTKSENKITGEEFKIILQKIYPYVEVIVISQNEEEYESGTIKKYNGRILKIDSNKYYEDNLVPIIQNSINKIKITRNILSKLENNAVVDDLLIENIKDSIEGISEYDNLKASDVDKLIEEFEKLREKIDG